MTFFKKKKILVTHNATFHADDIFATATLSLLFDGNIKVIRTRDEMQIKEADFVYDVGGEYDPALNRFDHHQKGGAGVRENNVPYASFGLVWKTYGAAVCGSKEVADRLDQKLVQAIDANDNGIELFNIKDKTAPYCIQDIFFAFRPSYKEAPEYDIPFMKMVDLACDILRREIIKMNDSLEAEVAVKKAYNQAVDKRIIVLDSHYPWGETLGNYPEPLYVVFPKVDTWRLECVRKEKYSFENRKPLPESWAGLRDADMAKGAMKLAEKALLA